MAEQKQWTNDELQHYLAHPDEVDATNESLVTALAAMELPEDMQDIRVKRVSDAESNEGKSETEADAEDARKAAAEAEAKIAAEEALTKAPGKDGAGKEAGAEKDAEQVVLARDGKSAIPYSVLENERHGREAAEAALAESQRNLVALSNKLLGREAATHQPRVSDVDKALTGLKADLPRLQSEAPWMVETVQNTIAAFETIGKEMKDLSNARAQDDAAVVQDLREAARDALDGNPTLTLWKADAKELYEEAVSADKYIREHPVLGARYPTFEARFDAAVRMVQANHDGEAIPLPEPVAQAVAAATSKTAAEAKPTPEVTARAKAALDKERNAGVRTLTDIPGGAGEQSFQEALESKSALEIAAMFDGKSPEEIVQFAMNH